MSVKVFHDMEPQEYHAMPRFSASGIKKLLISAQDFWVTSWLNPNQKKRETDAMDLGTAFDIRIISGEKAFMNTYVVVPDFGDKRIKENKAAYQSWLASNAGKKEISEEDWKQIIRVGERIDGDQRLFKYFRDGQPQTVVIWEDEESGVPMKAMLDYPIKKHQRLTDLKTFSNTDGLQINKRIVNSIKKYQYDVQMVVYNHAYKLAFGEYPELVLFFVQTGWANNIVVKPFPQELLMFRLAEHKVRDGIDKFAAMYHKFGSKPWWDELDDAPLDDDSFQLYHYDD